MGIEIEKKKKKQQRELLLGVALLNFGDGWC